MISRGGFELTHLFFADDLMLFGQATTTQIKLIMDSLNSFATVSGLKMNLSKSKLFTSPEVPSIVADTLSRLSEIPRIHDLRFYLGVPTLHGRVLHNTYKFILEKMETRLSSWKRNSLSLVGR